MEVRDVVAWCWVPGVVARIAAQAVGRIDIVACTVAACDGNAEQCMGSEHGGNANAEQCVV